MTDINDGTDEKIFSAAAVSVRNRLVVLGEDGEKKKKNRQTLKSKEMKRKQRSQSSTSHTEPASDPFGPGPNIRRRCGPDAPLYLLGHVGDDGFGTSLKD